MSESIEIIPMESLRERARGFREQGWRLVQISATRLPDQVELTYSFDRGGEMKNLRFSAAPVETRVPSISPVYGCAILYENEIHDLFNVQVEGLTVDFKGNLYKTAIKFPFGSTKAPCAKPAGTAAS
ncbi:MAG: NADH-quinone oxidoreductase subunit C [Verrucomicrobiota bacterium]